jgi:hypothetical protein
LSQFGVQTTRISHGNTVQFERSGSKGVISVYKPTFGAITPGSTDGGYMAYVVNSDPGPAAQAWISAVPE